MVNPYRPGSKLHDVYAVFADKGIEAAVAHGIKIGLSASTLKIQTKRKNWGGEAPASAKIEKPLTVARKSRAAESGKPRFKMSKKKGAREFIIIDKGEQQSLCRWIDTGEDQCMNNDWMIPA